VPRGLGIFAEERAPHRADLVTQASRILPVVFRGRSVWRTRLSAE